MSLFKHAMVSGINDALVDNGIVAWPNEKVGFEACASVAADLAGPDMLPTGGLAKESALLIADRLKTAADLLLANGYAPDASTVLRTKQAAQMDFGTRAAVMAEEIMARRNEDMGDDHRRHGSRHSLLAGTPDSMTLVGPIFTSGLSTWRRRNSSTFVKKRIAFSSMRKPWPSASSTMNS